MSEEARVLSRQQVDDKTTIITREITPTPSMMGQAARTIGPGLLQRKLAARLARKAAGQAASAPGAAIDKASQETGSPVDATVRRKVESATGTDLSGARVHTGDASQAAASSIAARAYTVGQDVHFNTGEYQPGSREGDRLIAHELVHAAQQGPGGAGPQAKLEVSQPGDSAETEADAIADAVVDGGPAAAPRARAVTAARKGIARKEFKTSSGSIKVDNYVEKDSDPGNDTDKSVGADIDISFHPGDALVTNKISFIQIMKCTQGDGNPLLFENEKPRATTKPVGAKDLSANKLVRLGSSGDEVKQLQEALNAQGASPKLVVDGAFGPKTLAAVKDFQSKQPLVVDGEVGPKTWNILNTNETGWTVDRLAGKKSPNYSQNNDGTSGGNTIFGSRANKTTFVDAWMHDGVNLPREATKTFNCRATTFALDNQSSHYLGGVRWGFDVDEKGKVTKAPEVLESSGDPGGVQKTALEKWNDQADNPDPAKKNDPNQDKVPVP